MFINLGWKSDFMRTNVFILFIIMFSCQQQAKQEKTADQDKNNRINNTKDEEQPIILFFGNSITAGYGLELDEAFPAIVQEKLDSMGIDYKVVNAGLSGETTAAGLNRIEWVLRTVPEIFVLELGANDGLRGVDLSETKKNLAGIIEKVRTVNPDVEVVIAGMEVPPNLGAEYTGEFRTLFAELAKEYNTHYIKFLLDEVAGNPDLNQSDGIHPTAEGHQIVAKTVLDALLPIIKQEQI